MEVNGKRVDSVKRYCNWAALAGSDINAKSSTPDPVAFTQHPN